MAITDNLVSYWKLDEASGNAADSVGSNTLTNTNTATYSAGKINNGANTSSTGSKYFTGTASLMPTGTTNWTVSNWIKTADNGSGNIWCWGTDSSKAKSYLNYSGGNTIGYGSFAADKTYSYTLTNGVWFHLAISYDGTNIYLYINGSLVSTQALTALNIGTTFFKVGTNSDTSAFWNGSIDELGIWSRALSATEAATLYNSGNGIQYPFAAPTVTTQAVSSISTTAATGNGNITVTGGTNAYQRGVVTVPGASGDITFIPLSDPSFEAGVTQCPVYGSPSNPTATQSTTQKKYGSNSLKLVNVASSLGNAGYQLESTMDVTTLRNKTLTLGVWVWCDTANRSFIALWDNESGDTNSAYHTGDSTWQFLTVTKTIGSGVTLVHPTVAFITSGTSITTYSDGCILAVSPNSSPVTFVFESGDYGTGAFTTSLTGLTANTAYRATAYATNPIGTSYGSTVAFTTLASGPTNLKTYNTNPATNIKSINTNLIANVKSLNTNV